MAVSRWQNWKTWNRSRTLLYMRPYISLNIKSDQMLPDTKIRNKILVNSKKRKKEKHCFSTQTSHKINLLNFVCFFKSNWRVNRIEWTGQTNNETKLQTERCLPMTLTWPRDQIDRWNFRHSKYQRSSMN